MLEKTVFFCFKRVASTENKRTLQWKCKKEGSFLSSPLRCRTSGYKNLIHYTGM